MEKENLMIRLRQALRIHESGDVAAAETVYAEVVGVLPHFSDAWHLWGLAAQDLGRHEDAVFRLGRAIAKGGEQGQTLYHLGVSLHALGRCLAAVACLEKAVRLEPDNPEFLAELANAMLEQKDLSRAESLYRQVLALKEAFPQVHYNLATVYRETGRDAQAVHHWLRTLELDPGHWKACFSLGLTLQFDNRIEEAVSCFSRAITLKPDYLRARWALHLALPTLFADEEEMIRARQRWMAGVDELQRTFFPASEVELEEARYACESTTNFHLHYQGGNDLEAQKVQGALLTRLAHRIYPGHEGPLPPAVLHEGRIHVAFVSSFLYGHSVFKTHSRFITRLDRRRFFVRVFYTGTVHDEYLGSIMRECDVFHDIGHRSSRLIEAICEVAPEVLIYTDLGMDPSLNLVSALRLAPIQCNAGGHPITSGLANMDYFLSSDDMECEHAAAHYSETLIRLPHLAHCYPSPRVEHAIIPPGAEREEGTVVYCNLQNLIKLLPRHDHVYPAIARAFPQARFWFIDVGGGSGSVFRRRLQRVFSRYDLDHEHYCRLFPKMDLYRFFGLIRQSDIILDGISWSGNNSSMEALALDKPIVTLPGEMFRSRHTHGILKRLGLFETQAENLERYIAIAVRLGKDPAFRASVTRSIAERKHVLYEDPEPIRGLERELERLVALNHGG
ncbi:MAG: tetratricopeptide repeat protein [Magnetococcales bacterium]|nr:tetratricopeptide repeat protein [Magnetococcales bacterium]